MWAIKPNLLMTVITEVLLLSVLITRRLSAQGNTCKQTLLAATVKWFLLKPPTNMPNWIFENLHFR